MHTALNRQKQISIVEDTVEIMKASFPTK